MDRQAIDRWIKEQGFPLEMRVASAFRNAGFKVRQSAWFKDPETGEQREIDVMATMPDPVGLGARRIAFVIECKSSSKPWVNLVSHDCLDSYNRRLAFSVMSRNSVNACVENIHQWSTSAPWWPSDNTCGYSFRQAFNDKDVGYAAAMSALKASYAYAAECPDFACAIVFPVIVVDTHIFEYSLSATGALESSMVPNSMFLFGRSVTGLPATRIRVLNVDDVDRFASEAREAADRLARLLSDQASSHVGTVRKLALIQAEWDAVNNGLAEWLTRAPSKITEP